MSVKIYQLKITLKGLKPPIWRRVEVRSDYTFAELHQVIQVVMDWQDSHLHNFELNRFHKEEGPRVFIEQDFDEEDDFSIAMPFFSKKVSENEEVLEDWLQKENDKTLYTYDFGDDWEHEVKLEKILEPKSGVSYPRCTKARRLTPDEDSRVDVMEETDEDGRWVPEEDPPPKELQQDINDELQHCVKLWKVE
ncbi:plasmid pRiA4b ORF-3 family protein [Alteribacillus iranensis]|uniref:PRiA4b ORF-3-like protein n=1 Tax=Alteribacillus iranensis TaxID=930128 RepID=A0A1I2E673_9BACI|nr:plasmid pRiA4b ORF-3 family protein [Alteribacillus iranensis]SFE88464.1 pRiA4b ORF-3-like protein [Alteribacillus iranensis]